MTQTCYNDEFQKLIDGITGSLKAHAYRLKTIDDSESFNTLLSSFIRLQNAANFETITVKSAEKLHQSLTEDDSFGSICRILTRALQRHFLGAETTPDQLAWRVGKSIAYTPPDENGSRACAVLASSELVSQILSRFPTLIAVFALSYITEKDWV